MVRTISLFVVLLFVLITASSIICVHRSPDQGRTWTIMGTAYPDSGDAPFIAFDPTIDSIDRDGSPVNAIYVTGVREQSNVFLSQSLNGGTTWSTLFQINESEAADQLLIAVLTCPEKCARIFSPLLLPFVGQAT